MVEHIPEFHLEKKIAEIISKNEGRQITPLPHEVFRYRTPTGVIYITKTKRKHKSKESWFEPRALSALSKIVKSDKDENISNALCYLHAAGTGMVIYTIGNLLLIPTFLLIDIFGTEIIGILMYVYILIMFYTHLVPFRLGMPIATINMDNGTISARGLRGPQNVIVNDTNPSHQVKVLGFTGLTINIPSANNGNLDGFMFISGFAIYAKSQ